MPCCHDPVILKDKDWVGVEFFYDQALTYEKQERAAIAHLVTKFSGYRRVKSHTPLTG